MEKKESEKIQSISLSLYRSTFERLVKRKDKKEMTHDQYLNYLMNKDGNK